MIEGQISHQFPVIPGSLTDYDQVESLYSKFPDYKEGLTWIKEFISKPDEKLGRSGDICPFTTPSMNQNLMRFVAIETLGTTASEAAEKCRMLIGMFYELFKHTDNPEDAALLAFFPHLSRDYAGDFIDGGHKLLRLDFVKSGLMLGEFHANCDVRSVRNGDFKVMQSPVPMFVVRKLSVHDLKFLDRPIYAKAERLEYLIHYKKYLAPTLGTMMLAEVDRRLKSLAGDVV